jgi:hypothetical protein
MQIFVQRSGHRVLHGILDDVRRHAGSEPLAKARNAFAVVPNGTHPGPYGDACYGFLAKCRPLPLPPVGMTLPHSRPRDNRISGPHRHQQQSEQNGNPHTALRCNLAADSTENTDAPGRNATSTRIAEPGFGS